MIIKINGTQVYNVKQGFVTNERLDEELDTGMIIFYNSVSSEYAPMSKVSEYLTSDTVADFEFLVDSDDCALITKQAPYVYMHTISLIEATKRLERQVVDNVAFTQPRDETTSRYTLASVFDRLIKISPLETVARLASNRLFALDSSLATELAAIKSPQFFFSNQNFLQCSNEIFKYLNGIARVKSYTGTKAVITKDDFNKMLATIDLSGYFSYAKANNSEYYANKLDINLENGIADQLEVFPAEPNVMALTTSGFVMTTNDLQLELPRPIYAINKVVMIAKYAFASSAAYSFVYREIDITNYVYEKTVYDTLPINTAGVPSKYGTVVYSKGGNKITGFGNSFPQFWGMFPSSTLEKILSDNAIIYVEVQGETLPFGLVGGSSGGAYALKGNIGFRVYYYPYISQRVHIQKQVPNFTENYMITSNQSGKAIDIKRILSNAQGTINRLGNGDLAIEKAVKTLANCYKVGQKTADGYIVTNVENQYFNDFCLSKATLTKNFNRLSQYVGVDREFRQYEIPLNETVNRNLIYEEYLCLDTVVEAADASGWSADAISLMSRMFTSSYASYFKTIGGVIATTKNIYGQSLGNFMLSVAKSSYSNSNIFYFKFMSNTVAYYYPIKQDTDFLTQQVSQLMPVRYVYNNGLTPSDILNGTFENMSIKLISDALLVDVDTLVIDEEDYDTAYASYQTVQTTYPYGLYYHLARSWTDPDGYIWDYILIKGDASKIYGLLKEDILKDLVYSMEPIDGNAIEAFTSHPAYLAAQYNVIRRQQEIDNADIAKYFVSDYSLMGLDDLVVKKDPSEVIAMTYQLQYVSRKSSIVIGPSLAEKSPYAIKRADLTASQKLLYLYVSTDYYRDGDTACKGSKYVDSAFTFTSTNLYVTAANGFSISAGVTLTAYNSWAIGDGDGNLYFGVNRNSIDGLPSLIHFHFKNKL